MALHSTIPSLYGNNFQLTDAHKFTMGNNYPEITLTIFIYLLITQQRLLMYLQCNLRDRSSGGWQINLWQYLEVH